MASFGYCNAQILVFSTLHSQSNNKLVLYNGLLIQINSHLLKIHYFTYLKTTSGCVRRMHSLISDAKSRSVLRCSLGSTDRLNSTCDLTNAESTRIKPFTKIPALKILHLIWNKANLIYFFLTLFQQRLPHFCSIEKILFFPPNQKKLLLLRQARQRNRYPVLCTPSGLAASPKPKQKILNRSSRT